MSDCDATEPRGLPAAVPDVSLLAMYPLARLLQIVGLAIPPLAIFAQLAESITLGQMLGFVVAAVCLFYIGNLLQRYSGGGGA